MKIKKPKVGQVIFDLYVDNFFRQRSLVVAQCSHLDGWAYPFGWYTTKAKAQEAKKQIEAVVRKLSGK